MTEPLLLDTDVVSDIFKRRSWADRYRSILQGKKPAISFMSVAELYRWTLARNWGKSRFAALEMHIQGYVIIGYDAQLAWVWAAISATCSKAGKPMNDSDAWIAASAVRSEMRLVTRNIRHFEAAEECCGLRLLRI